MLFLIPVFLLIIINLFISSHFSPTWDFPMHLLAGQIRLGEVAAPLGYHYLFYGVFTDIIPLLFSRLFPLSWFPASYLLFAVVIGSLGVIFFYFLVKEGFGKRKASLAAVTLLFLPRFVGHWHTNIKDVVTISFFIIAAYYFYHFLKQGKWKHALVSMIFYLFSVNTKPTALSLYPIFVAWAVFHDKKGDWTAGKILFLILYFLLPAVSFILLWPASFATLIDSIMALSAALGRFPLSSRFYAVEQLLATTPLIVLVFVPFGLLALFLKIKKDKDSLSFFFLILFIYTLFKYPIFGLPVIDDVRYFLEIYFPLALAFVLGVEYLVKKYVSPLLTNYIFILFFVYFLLLNVIYHPYQISFYNSLAQNKDPDFWAASYREVFDFVNKTAPAKTIVSARLAPELAAYLIREDLKKNLNTKAPEESDIVVILNRPSFFGIFQADDFILNHRPTKVITNRLGVPLSYIYLKLNP